MSRDLKATIVASNGRWHCASPIDSIDLDAIIEMFSSYQSHHLGPTEEAIGNFTLFFADPLIIRTFPRILWSDTIARVGVHAGSAMDTASSSEVRFRRIRH